MTRWPIALLLAVAAFAQTKEQKGKQVVEEAVQALGGNAFTEMRDRVESGRAYSFYRERLSGLSRATIYTRYLTAPAGAAPGKLYVRERQAFGKDQDYAILFDEEKGYQITFRGAMPLPAATLTRYHETTPRNVFYILRQRLQERGMLIELRGSEVLDNQPVDVVDFTDAENIVVTVYFHRSTKLPIRQVFHRRDPVTRERIEELSLFGKYRNVGGGVQWPYAIQRYRNGEKIYEIFSDSVTVNQGLNDQLFTLPANLKILPPPR